MYRLMVADVDSPSYFVATAAVALGFFAREGKRACVFEKSAYM
jgi:hypothetical protein